MSHYTEMHVEMCSFCRGLFTSLEDVLDEHFGKRGTLKRDLFEADVEAALHTYHIGEAIRNERLKQNLTQEQLGERLGVKKTQIARTEHIG